MIDAKTIKDWINAIPDGKMVAIADDAMRLIVVDRKGRLTREYLEVGATPTKHDFGKKGSLRA